MRTRDLDFVLMALTRDGRVRGVALADGTEFAAPFVMW